MGTTTVTIPRVLIAFSASLLAGDSTAPTTAEVGVGYQFPGFSPAVGTASGDISNVYSSELAVTYGTPLTLDMTSLTDPSGNSINFARVQGIWLQNGSTTSGQDATLQGGASNPLFANVMTVMAGNNPLAGGVMGIWNPVPGWVVSSTVKTLKVTVAAGTSVPLALCIAGNTT